MNWSMIYLQSNHLWSIMELVYMVGYDSNQWSSLLATSIIRYIFNWSDHIRLFYLEIHISWLISTNERFIRQPLHIMQWVYTVYLVYLGTHQ